MFSVYLWITELDIDYGFAILIMW